MRISFYILFGLIGVSYIQPCSGFAFGFDSIIKSACDGFSSMCTTVTEHGQRPNKFGNSQKTNATNTVPHNDPACIAHNAAPEVSNIKPDFNFTLPKTRSDVYPAA